MEQYGINNIQNKHFQRDDLDESQYNFNEKDIDEHGTIYSIKIKQACGDDEKILAESPQEVHIMP